MEKQKNMEKQENIKKQKNVEKQKNIEKQNIEEEKKTTGSKNIYKIIAIVLMAVLVVVLFIWGHRMWVEKRAYDKYDELAEQVNDISQMEPDTEQLPEVIDSEIEEQLTDLTTDKTEQEIDRDLLTFLGLEVPKKNLNWDGLKAENGDIYAWIYIPDTVIEYPIVQHPSDDEYYLANNLDKKEGNPGCIFTQRLNSKDFTDCNTVIYGHNMRSGKMFRGLHDYEDPEFFKSHPYIYIYTEGGPLVYQVFAAYKSDDAHILYANDFSTMEGFQVYLDKVFNNTDTTANIDKTLGISALNHIITLSTCTGNPSERYLVQAVLLNDKTLYGIE